jgi:multisubunit Na+/H+ antiporter MnhG subunit
MSIDSDSRAIPTQLARIWLSILFALALTAASEGQDSANAADEASPTSRALSTTPWFDGEQGKLIPFHIDPVNDDSLNRESRWLPKAKRVRQPVKNTSKTKTGTTGTGGNILTKGIFGTTMSLTNLLGWILLFAFIALAVGALFYALSRSEFDSAISSKTNFGKVPKSPNEQTLERMKHLPAELRRTDVNLRHEAERLMQSGNYDQAIILLFGHQLLLLDRIGILRLNRGKTNRKYVRETRSTDSAAAKCLQATATAFERSYFGRHKISQRKFADIWRANEQLEKRMDQRRGEAA